MTERISQSGSHSQQAQFHVTHTELLNLAKTNHCAGIQVEPLLALCRPEKNRWVFEATVYKSAKCRGFAGYGEAHPGKVSPLNFNHAEMGMAETRAANRAHRTAYSVAICSLEVRPPSTLSPEQLSVLHRALQYRPPIRKGVLCEAPTNPPHSRQLVALLRAWAEKNPGKSQSAMYICSRGHE